MKYSSCLWNAVNVSQYSWRWVIRRLFKNTKIQLQTKQLMTYTLRWMDVQGIGTIILMQRSVQDELMTRCTEQWSSHSWVEDIWYKCQKKKKWFNAPVNLCFLSRIWNFKGIINIICFKYASDKTLIPHIWLHDVLANVTNWTESLKENKTALQPHLKTYCGYDRC